MKKSILFALVMTLTVSVSFSQTTKTKLDEVKNNPRTNENAARADAQQVNKTSVANTKAVDFKVLKRKQQGRKLRLKKATTTAS
jgi:hypothetical protein